MATSARVKKGAPRERYWVSFDLGLMGDYSPLYEWLDSHKAEECVDGLATFTSPLTRDQLAEEIKRTVNNVNRPRVYLISRQKGGRFVVGGRKTAPWIGSAVSATGMADEV